MNKIVTVKRLVEIVAKTAGVDAELSENFVRAFTQLVREGLAAGQSVAVAGVGKFEVRDGKVAFTPDASLAQAVNAPFAMFQPEELAPAATDQVLNAASAPEPHASAESPEPELPAAEQPEQEPELPAAEQPEPEPELPAAEQPTSVAEVAHGPELPAAPEPEPAAEPQVLDGSAVEPSQSPAKPAPPEQEEDAYSMPLQPIDKAVAEMPDPELSQPPTYADYKTAPAKPAPEDEEEDEYQPPRSEGFPYFWLFIGVIAGLLIGLLVGFFLHDPIMEVLQPELSEGYVYVAEDESPEDAPELAAPEQEDEPAEAVAPAPAEETTPSATQAEPAPQEQAQAPAQPKAEAEVWDTITNKTFLAHLARKYYGHNDFWVYIYMENASAIGDPNKVKAGTRVKIPPYEKYATAATKELNLAAARQKAKEIQAKYK